MRIAPILGRAIDHEMKRRGLQGKDLAELLGMSPATISGWRQGHHCPETYLIPRLCDALECSPNWLFYDTVRRMPGRGHEAAAKRLAKRLTLEQMRALASVPAEAIVELIQQHERAEKSGSK